MLARRAFTSASLRSRKIWRDIKRCRTRISDRFFHLFLFPDNAYAFCGGHELGHRNVWGFGYRSESYLFHYGQELLYRTSLAGQERMRFQIICIFA
jgi:hypothetical protein